MSISQWMLGQFIAFREKYVVLFSNWFIALATLTTVVVLWHIWWSSITKGLIQVKDGSTFAGNMLQSDSRPHTNVFDRLIYTPRTQCIPRWSFVLLLSLSVWSTFRYIRLIVRICVLHLIIVMKSEVWLICHCLGLGHDTMVWAVCLAIFLWICYFAIMIYIVLCDIGKTGWGELLPTLEYSPYAIESIFHLLRFVSSYIVSK